MNTVAVHSAIQCVVMQCNRNGSLQKSYVIVFPKHMQNEFNH